MSQRTAPALSALDEVVPLVNALPDTPDREALTEDIDALRRAIAAFHMEAIRFRMYSVDRGLARAGASAALREKFEQLRKTLEAAGFHTRSHTAP